MPARPSELVLLDGGVGQEVFSRRTGPASRVWATQVMIDRPDLVEAVHLDFIRAGARIITVNAYAVTPQKLARVAKVDMFDELQHAALDAAHRARDTSGENVSIAGCLPPLAGSYRAELTPPDDVCLSDYRRIVGIQADRVDLFLCETMVSAREARIATTVAAESGKPVWTALTVDERDGTLLRSGDPVSDGVEAAIETGAEAVLVNCSSPESTTAALPILAGRGVPFGAYANGFVTVAPLRPGKTVDILEARRDLDPKTYVHHVRDWIAQGATIVGGCCEIGPEHIAVLARDLQHAGHDLVSAFRL
ncbi:MAG: homocysteine S-methyltransferase family protein [Alphaproteobacteria bacterium]|nr:homocysteine S-methyltransferase family protein [Alphaproteobacteria bacterium]